MNDDKPGTNVATVAPQEVMLPTNIITPMDMIDRAIGAGSDVETLNRLMDLQERHEANMGRKAFDFAISLAKAEFGPIHKNRKVDFTSKAGRTNYAFEDLSEIARNVDPVLSQHGLSYRWRTEQSQSGVKVTCVLSHRDGYSEETCLSAPNDQSGNKNSIQAIGSTVTYLQRYTLKAALGLAISHDDDGQAASKKGTISAKDAAEFRDLITKSGADEAGFLKFAKADDVDDILASDVARLRKLLDAKISKAKAENSSNV